MARTKTTSAAFSSFTATSFTPNERLLKLLIAAATGTAHVVALLKTLSCPACRIRFSHGLGILQLLSVILGIRSRSSRRYTCAAYGRVALLSPDMVHGFEGSAGPHRSGWDFPGRPGLR